MVCLSCQPARNSDQHSSSVKVPAQHSVQWAMHAELAPGTPIYAVGSPFGVLSPGHFANSVIHGVVSNRWPGCASGQHSGCLLTADIRSMPGMEGSPVLNSQEQVVAVLLPPLLSREFSAEVGSRCLQLLQAGFLSCTCWQHLCSEVSAAKFVLAFQSNFTKLLIHCSTVY